MRLCARLGDRGRDIDDDDDGDERGVLPLLLLLLLLRDYIVADELLPVTWYPSDKECSVTATDTSGQVREDHRTGKKKGTCNSRWV